MLESQSKESRRIKPMDGWPTVHAIAYVSCNAGAARNIDHNRHEPVITHAVDGRRKSNHARPHAAVCCSKRRNFGIRARHRWNGSAELRADAAPVVEARFPTLRRAPSLRGRPPSPRSPGDPAQQPHCAASFRSRDRKPRGSRRRSHVHRRRDFQRLRGHRGGLLRPRS